jgi:phosphatidylserine synthase 2
MCVLVFQVSYSYLRPDALEFFHPMQRFWRVMHMMTLVYFSGIIILLNHRPSYGRWLLGYFDPLLNQDVTKGHHTYDDNCEFTLANVWDNFDHYYFIHWMDWFLASFVIRDFPILHLWHVLNEF